MRALLGLVAVGTDVLDDVTAFPGTFGAIGVAWIAACLYLSGIDETGICACCDAPM